MKFDTRYFGKITIDESNEFEFLDLAYNGKKINISMHECLKYGDKIRSCIYLMDRYPEINAAAKKSVLEKFRDDETVNYYFKCHFDVFDHDILREIFGTENFDEISIESVVEGLKYPNFLFSLDEGAIELSVDYRISEDYSDEILCVKMDEKMNVKGFSHES